MMKHGKGGAIVNLSSVAGLAGFPSACAYVASKHAVAGLTKAIAIEYGHKGIRCNATSPCGSGTPLNKRTSEAFMAKLGQVAQEGQDPKAYMAEWMLSGKAQSPLGRDGTADEQASAILYLLSDEASYINGVVMPVEGGWVCY